MPVQAVSWPFALSPAVNQRQHFPAVHIIPSHWHQHSQQSALQVQIDGVLRVAGYETTSSNAIPFITRISLTQHILLAVMS